MSKKRERPAFNGILNPNLVFPVSFKACFSEKENKT